MKSTYKQNNGQSSTLTVEHLAGEQVRLVVEDGQLGKILSDVTIPLAIYKENENLLLGNLVID